MVAIVGVRIGTEVRYVSVQAGYGLDEVLPEWAGDAHAAEALLAFGPLRSIGWGSLERNTEGGAAGAVTGDDTAFITTALQEHRAGVVALYDPDGAGWQVWEVGMAAALRAIGRADVALQAARDLTAQAVRLVDASQRMARNAAPGARKEARDLARQAEQKLDAANVTLGVGGTNLHDAVPVRNALERLGYASTIRQIFPLRMALKDAMQEIERFTARVTERREQCEVAASSIPAAALQPLPGEEDARADANGGMR